MKKKQGRRVLYGLVGVVMAATAIGGVAAKESKPYDAPELRLAKGMDDYNLLEGITYNEDKYELEVADEGQFDIDVLGKYEVEYALIPIDPEETVAGTAGGTTGGAGGGVGTGSTAGSVTESTAVEESSEAETSAGEPDTAGTDGAAENTDAAESTEAAETTGAATENEKVETSGAADENPTEAETSETKESDSSHETDGSEAGGSGTKESESADQNSSGNENAGTAEDTKTETEGNVKSEAEGDAKSEAKDDAKPEVEDSKTSAKADNIFSGLLKRLTGYVYAAETKDEEAGLDETEKVIRFTRDVRVVTSLDAPNIEYDAPLLQIPADADLYELVINKEMQVATPSQAEKKATPDRPEKKEIGQLATDMQLEREPDREENDGVEVEFDGMTEEGVEYNLVLKNPGLILEDAVLADETGKKIKKAKVTISNDSDLKTAVEVIDGLDGAPMILGLREGRYEVTLSAIEPKSGEEIQCVREIEVISGEHIRFQAPTLYIGTHNSSYNLTDGMYAVDENGNEVTALYVIDDSELHAARIGAKATPANAESQMDDGSLENGEEQGDEEVSEDEEAQENGETRENGETQEELAEGTELKKGTYHVVLGAKHPISGEEFTVIREVQVIDGYYIYAPDLEIEAGSTDYNLLEGAEVRDASENGAKVDAPMEVTDISDLLRGAEDESEGVETESTASEDTGLTEDEVISGSVNIDNGEALMTAFSLETDGENADGVSGIKTAGEADTETIPDSESHPAVKKGIYRVTLSTVDAQTGETRTVVRTVRAVRTQFPMTATFTAYAPNISEGITALFEANNMDSQMRAGVGGVDLHLGSGFTLQKMQERMENRAYTLDSVGADSPLLGQTIIAPGYDASVVMEKYADWTGQLLVGEKTVKVFEAIKTFRYRVQNDTLAKMLGYAGQWYQSYGYKATGFPTGHDVNQNYIFWYTGSMGSSLCEKYMTKVDTSKDRQFTIENATQNNKVFDVNPVLGSKPYVGYMATKHYIDAAGNNGGWNWNIPEHENFGYHLVTTGYWKNVGYYEKGRATWEKDDTSGRDLYKAGDKKTFKNGWLPDVTVTANVGQVEDLTAEMLNAEELYKNSPLAANGIGLESSILVDGKGKTLEIQNVANGNARKSILVPNMQLGFQNFSNMAANFTIAKDGYLRLEDIHGTNNDPRYIFDVGSLDTGKQALNNGSTLEIVGPATAGDMKAFNVWNIQNVIVRAGEADMSPVRVVNKTTEDAVFDQLIDTHGKTVTFYQSFNQASNGKATTTLTGGGTVDFAQTRSLDYAGDTAEPEIGNLMTTGQLVLKGDVSLSKSSYTNPNGPGGADIKNYTALKINGGKRTDNNYGKFRSNGYRITAVAGSHGHGDFVAGEIFAGQGAGSDLESTAILDPTDFVLGAPQEGTPTEDGKYLYLTSKNDSKTIFVTALDHKAISVDPGIGGEKISWYNTYEEALNAISGQGIKGTDYIVTNYIEREFSENASDLLENLSIEKAESVTFTSASRDAAGLEPNLGAGDRFLVRMRRGIFKAPQEVKVVFKNMALRYDQGDNNDPKLGTDANMVFTADGGDLVIDDDCVFLGAVKTYKKQNGDTTTFDTWSNMLPTVYAGAVSGDSNKTSSVTIKSGFYEGVYGGNMEGTFRGSSTITIEQTDESRIQQLSVPVVDGASKVDTDKPNGKKATIRLVGPKLKNGSIRLLALKKVYNYDLMEVKGCVAISEDGMLHAQKLTGNYAGETELKDGTDFYLLNKTGAKIMGSLHGDRAVGMAANSILTQARVDSNTKDPTNEELVTLTGTDPLHTADKTLKARVQLTYTGETYGNAELGDILLNLKNVPAAEAAKRVSADNLGSDFKNDMMATAKPDTKTIVLAEGTVRVVWGFIQEDGAYKLGYFETSVASALQSIAKEEKTRKEKGETGYGYVISMFEEGYILNNNDFNAMSSNELADVAQIDWVSFIGMEETNVGGKKVRKVKVNTNPATVVPSDDWVFYGKANRLGKIKLKYDQPKALYANGSVLTTSGDLVIDAKDDHALPAVYGGGTKDVNVGDTRLILRGGRFSKVYGGGYGKTGSTYVELASSQKNIGTEQNPVYEPLLEVTEVYGGGLSETKDTTVVAKGGKINGIYGGGNGKDAVVQGNTHVQIETTYGMEQLNISKASIYGGGKDESRVSAGKTRKITIAYQGEVPGAGVYSMKSEVNNIEDFDLLEIGNTTKPNFIDDLTVTGRIISDSKGNQYTGDVALHHSRINFQGAESSHIRNLTKDGNNNRISIMKDANQTYPLLLDGTFTSDPQDSKLTLTHNGTAADGDVMLEFREQANAREEQYDTNLIGVAIVKNLAEKKENQIILKAYSVLVGKLVNNNYQISEFISGKLVYTHYTSVAKALNKVGQYAKDAEAGKSDEEIKNGAAGTYFISIYRDNYEFTKQDYEAMLKTAEPGNDAEDPLSYVKDTTLEWCSNYGTLVKADKSGYDVRKDLSPRTVRISGDLNFAGQNVTVKGLKLRYLNERNIFANGMPLTINYDVEIAKEDNAANYPTIYGGGNWPVGSTNLTVMSGNYRYIYGGGASEKGRVTGDTKLLLSDKPVSVIAGNSLVGTAQKQSQITADGVFGGGKGYVNGNTEVSVYTGTYGWLYGGGFGGNGTVKGNTEVMIYGNANKQVSVTDTLAGGGRSQAFTEGKSAIRVWYAQNTALNPIPVNLTVKDVSDFDVLQVGNVNASNTISKMTVSGKLRGRYDSTAKETGGTLVFRNGQVSFTGPYNPTVKDLNTAGANSQMIIYKDTKTYPMMAKGTMTLYKEKETDPENPLGLNVSQNAAERDILLDFKEEPNAQDGHYKWLGVTTLNVFKDNNQIILDRNGRFFMKSAKINTIVDSIMNPYNANTLFWQTKKKASDSKGSWTELTKGEEHAGIKGINNDPEVILEARQDKFGGGADWWNNFTNAGFIEGTRDPAHSLLVDGKNKTYYAYENSAWNHKSDTGVSMQVELRNCTLPITSRFKEGNGDLYMNIRVSPNGYLKLNNIRMQDGNLRAGGHWYSLYANQSISECPANIDSNTTIELVSGLPSEKNWITPAYATGGATHQIIRASESDFVSPIRVDSAKQDMYVSTNGDHKLWFTWLSASSGDNLRFAPSPYLKLNGVRRTVQRKDGSEIAVEDIKNLTEEEKKEFYVDVDQLDLNEVGTVVLANECQIWMDPVTFKSKIHQQVIELESDINILKSTRDSSIGAFYITKAYISNGYTMRLGANNLQTEPRHDGVGYANPRMRLDGEVAGRATFPLDPNLFDVVEEQKYEYDANKVRTAVWEIVNSDTDVNTIVFRRYNTKPHPIWLYCDCDDSDAYKIGEYDSYEAALEKVKEEVEKDRSNTYFLKAVVPTTFTELDRDALKTLDLGDKAKNIHLTFTGSLFVTGHGKILYGDRYHITSKVSRIEMPAGVSVTWNQAVAFEQASLEADGLENPVFVGNGGALIFDEKFIIPGVAVSETKADGTITTSRKDMKASIYGGSLDLDNQNVRTSSNEILIRTGAYTDPFDNTTKTTRFKDIYGGGQIDQTGDVNIMLSGKSSAERIFGGGSSDKTNRGTLTGNSKITVADQAVVSGAIYGGGENADVNGDTEIHVSSSFATTEDTAVGIYGGGHNGTVSGNTKVNVTTMNTADTAKTKFYFTDITGYGTDADGNLSDHVKGQTKEVTIQSNDPTKQSYVYVKQLSGFTALQLGKEENWAGRAYGNFIVQVADRFDGSPTAKSILVSATDPAEKRTDAVSIYGAELRMTGEWQGRIGSVNTYGSAGITVHKKEGLTYPLILDGTVTRDAETYMINLNTTATNRTNDRVLTFTTKDHGDSSIYRDNGGTELSVQQLDGADVRYIIFKTPQRHQIFSYVTYEANDPGVDNHVTLDQNVDNRTRSKKKIHFLYDPGKETDTNAESNKGHGIRGGYLAVMPKSVAVNADETTKWSYEKMDSGFANLGGGALGNLPDLTASGGSTYPITLTTDPDTGKITGDVEALAIDDSDTGYWYVAHFICDNGNETFSHLVDVSAPIPTSADVTSYSTEDKDYIFTFTYRDSFENDTTKVPRKWVDGKANPFPQTYGNHGISQKVYWALGDADGNALAEAEAAKAVDFGETIAYDVNSDALKGVGVVMNTDGSQAVDSSDTAKITVRVPANIAEQKDKYLWIYIKDQENNTVRYGIPLNDNQISVRVPLSVYVVALKKEKGGDPELLAPSCYIVNDGTNHIEAKISNFKMEDEANSPIQLTAASNVEAFDNRSKQLALFVETQEMEDLADVTLARTNVKSIDPKDHTTWPLIGILGPQNEDSRTRWFTFKAIYDPKEIDETNDTWIKNTMSYYFTITGKPGEMPDAGFEVSK